VYLIELAEGEIGETGFLCLSSLEWGTLLFFISRTFVVKS